MFSLLRVGGRLSNAPISYDAKFPLLLIKRSEFVQSYVRHLNQTDFHVGPRVPSDAYLDC